MIKKCGILLVVIIVFLEIFFSFQYVYAINSFFEVKEREVSKESNVELIINLEKIEYDKFKFELVSDAELSSINTSENIEVEKNDNEIYIEIDKKVTNLNKIIFTYKIPEDKKIGDNIMFVANITNLEDEKETQTEQVEITIVEDKNEQSNDNKGQSEDKKEQSIDNKNKEENQKNIEQEQNHPIVQENPENQDLKSQMNFEKEENKTTSTSNSSIKAVGITKSENNKTSSLNQVEAESVIYNGSNNNYLSNLSVEGYNLNKEFSKESNTYFINIDKSVSSININAEGEDDTAKVCVYGNVELKEGLNKVLVNVTAENGTVRTYRIYVTIKT